MTPLWLTPLPHQVGRISLLNRFASVACAWLTGFSVPRSPARPKALKNLGKTRFNALRWLTPEANQGEPVNHALFSPASASLSVSRSLAAVLEPRVTRRSIELRKNDGVRDPDPRRNRSHSTTYVKRTTISCGRARADLLPVVVEAQRWGGGNFRRQGSALRVNDQAPMTNSHRLSLVIGIWSLVI